MRSTCRATPFGSLADVRRAERVYANGLLFMSDESAVQTIR
jgi:hypothetical protein